MGYAHGILFLQCYVYKGSKCEYLSPLLTRQPRDDYFNGDINPDAGLFLLTHPPLQNAAFSKMISQMFGISIKISLRFVPKHPVDNISALVSKMDGAEQSTSHFWNQC